MPGVQEIGITVNAGGAPHWMAIKNQELFASAVMPHFQRTGELAGVTPERVGVGPAPGSSLSGRAAVDGQTSQRLKRVRGRSRARRGPGSLRVLGVSRSFEGIQALQDVDLEFDPASCSA